MRITFICPNADLSGGIRVIATYAQRLYDRGHDVVVISKLPDKPSLPRRALNWIRGRGRTAPNGPGRSHFDNLTVDVHRIPPNRPLRIADLPDADVLIATWWQTAEWIEHAPRSKGAKVFFAQGYEVAEWLPEERVRRVWTLPFHKIVVAQWLKDLAREEFGDDDASLVPNSVDLSQFEVPAREKPDHPIVGFVYSPARFRGCDTILDAVAAARKRVPELRLVAFSSHPLCDSLPLPPHTDFSFTPTQDKIRATYASCTAWLFGSRREGFGLPLLEAMACRTPVIATPGGAAPEILSRGGGFLVPPEDSAAMAQRIEAICAMSASDWRRLSDEAYSNAVSYTWDDAVDRFEAALNRAIEKSPATASPKKSRTL